MGALVDGLRLTEDAELGVSTNRGRESFVSGKRLWYPDVQIACHAMYRYIEPTHYLHHLVSFCPPSFPQDS